MEFKLNVKDKSVQVFLEERLLGYHSNNRMDSHHDISVYNLMKDEMFFKIDCGIEIGETVRIELFDTARMSGKGLVNIYIYKAEQYDDVAIKMILEHFSIENKSEFENENT